VNSTTSNHLLGQIEVDLKKQGRKCTNLETDNGQHFLIFWGQVRVTDDDRGGVYPCDTTLHLKIIDQNQPGYSEHAIFGTFIFPGRSGNTGIPFNQAVDKLNYDFLGKFVRDHTDKSQDILYVTTEYVNNLTSEVVLAHLDHHAKVKATVTPRLENMIDCEV